MLFDRLISNLGNKREVEEGKQNAGFAEAETTLVQMLHHRLRKLE